MIRRQFVAAAGATVAAGMGAKLVWSGLESGWRADVFVARAATYEVDLERIVRDGLTAVGWNKSRVRGKSILLKPNLVEPSRDRPHINTDPRFVHAVAEVFRRWDAGEVFVAEGPGHHRDIDLVLDESGMTAMLRESGLEFVDLNVDDLFAASNACGLTRLSTLHLPASLRRADLVVSLPKLKTHHWAGVTLSMKNLFGMMPGVAYGWPKNVLHHAGIPQSIVDLAATIQTDLAIVDGIVGMDGDGPIMGTAKRAGVVVIGRNLPAVDATAARLMDIDPRRVEHLRLASGRLGPIHEPHIRQRGEPLAPLVQRFEVLEQLGLR